MKTSRRDFLRKMGYGLSGFVVSGITGQANITKEKSSPNVVLIFTDDQGYQDLEKYGADDFKTPNLNRLADQGMIFKQFYASQAVCSASRASLLTGCYAERIGIQGALMPWSAVGLNPQEETIAELLKRKNYKTAAFGKWHLGHHKKFLPLNHGFDEYLGIPYSNDMWPVDFDGKKLPKSSWKAKYPPLPLIKNNKKIEEIKDLAGQDTLTTRYTKAAVDFINRNKNSPFFLYLPHSMPHVPLGVSKKFKGKSKQGMYGDVIMEIDWSVGQILDVLEKHNLENNTLVIFASDNGPWLNFGNHAGSTGPLREGKGTMYEGGPRVPCIMSWPGIIPKGSICEKMAATIDILPTIAAVTKTGLPKKPIDGKNIISLLKGEKTNPRNSYFYYYGGELRAVRKDQWKLIFPHKTRSYEGVKPGKDGYPGKYNSRFTKKELYNLKTDIGEQNNLLLKYPNVVAELDKLALEARTKFGDHLTGAIGNEIREPGRIGLENAKKIKHLAIGKDIKYNYPFHPRYAGGENALLNGISGSFEFNDGSWQGFEYHDLNVVIDLGKNQKVKQISTGFLRNQGSWIFLPESVVIYISNNNKDFDRVHRVTNKNVQNFENKIWQIKAKLNSRSVRFIKVIAKNIQKCPTWHPGAGGRCWIFIDELIVK